MDNSNSSVSVVVAEPAALGLFSYGMALMVLSAVNLGLLPKAGADFFLGFGLFFGGAGLYTASRWAYRRNNTFDATAFAAYGLLLMVLGTVKMLAYMKILVLGPWAGDFVGYLMFVWGLFTVYMWAASWHMPRVVWWVFLTMAILFFLLALAEWHVLPSDYAGYCGYLSALIAWYGSLAFVVNNMAGRTVLSLGSKAAKSRAGAFSSY